MTETPGRRILDTTLSNASVVIAIVVTLLVVWFARDVLLLAFAGVLLAVCFRTVVRLLHGRLGIPQGLGLAIVVLVLVGGTVAIFWIRGPAIVREFDALRESVPRAAASVEQRLTGSEWGRRAVAELPTFEDVLPDARSVISKATGVVSRTFSAMTTFVIVLFLGIAFAATPRPYVEGILALVPAGKVPRAREILQRLEVTLWWWMAGRILSMLVVAVSTGIGLWLLGVPLSFTLAFIAGLLTFVPNIGPLLAAIPAVLLGLAQSPRMALYVVLLYVGVQAVETYVIAPVVDRKTVALPPALTVIAQLLLVTVAGIVGAALAAPLAAVIVVLITALYVQDFLGRREIGASTEMPTLPE